MGKFTIRKSLSKPQIEELFVDFARALASVKNAEEAARFIQDLLSEQEVIMLARRLQVARLLIDGFTYQQIQKTMKASGTTVAKVQTWLNLYGEGYRTVLQRTKSRPELEEGEDSLLPWAKLKRKYPMYFWPELLLKEIIKTANAKERKKLHQVVRQLKDKTKLSRDLTKILQSDKYYHTQ